MGLENKINQTLNKYPKLKKQIKRVYQRINYAISKKTVSKGNIARVSPDDPSKEYFFGYYGICPEDASGRYILCMKADDTSNDVAPAEPAQILLIDTTKCESDPERVRELGKTHTWNVQQGCMLQWLGPDYDRKIIYNDFRDNKYCSVILDVFTGAERVLQAPIYSVSTDGSFALTLDFSRLHRMRPGYGYSNLPDHTNDQKIPNQPCIWKLDINSNELIPILNYYDLVAFEPRLEMEGAEHKVNHIMISPNGQRFMVLHRWLRGDRKYTRLITVNADGSDLFNLSDEDMVSHCYWKNDEEIIAFENKKVTGAGYYLMKDKTHEYTHLWPHISSDGHPSYSPDGRMIVSDTYPDRKRMAQIKIMSKDMNITVGSVLSPFKYDNETRCDLHPRWSRDGKKIYFDSVFEGHRGLYSIDVSGISFAYPEMIGTELPASDNSQEKIRVVFLMTSCRKSGPTQVVINIIKNLDSSKFEPILVTMYDEEEDSQMAQILPYVRAHFLVKTGKKAIITKNITGLKNLINDLDPKVIYSTGVFPDYAVSQFSSERQMITLHNYVYEDYLAKFGKIRGILLAHLQLSAIRKAKKVVACSESLSKIYQEKLKLTFDFIRNGVDLGTYKKVGFREKRQYRKDLKIPEDAFVFIYTGQFIERKNVSFLLKNFSELFKNNSEIYLILLGDGPDFKDLCERYSSEFIDFRGSVNNVDEYLQAADVYVSTSKSEGLPNGVLEAMATGLPVVLSDIRQHLEILEVNNRSGFAFQQNNGDDFQKKLLEAYSCDINEASNAAYNVAHTAFDAKKMSTEYQAIYNQIFLESK